MSGSPLLKRRGRRRRRRLLSDSIADLAVRYALAQVGKPYVFATAGPDSFDCSGLVYAAYKAAGYSAITRSTYTQVLQGSPVEQSQLGAGDLVFPDAGHVQIYVGGGQVCEAPHSGANVRVVNLWGFWAARRLVAPAGGDYVSADTGVNADTIPASHTSGLLAASDAIASIGRVAGNIIDPSFWRRIGIGVVGGFVMFEAYKYLTKEGV
jgi:hypothetical protein